MSKTTPKFSKSLLLSLCLGLSLSAHAELIDHSTSTTRTISPTASPYDLPEVKSYSPSSKTVWLTALYNTSYDSSGGLLIANEASLKNMNFDAVKYQAEKGNKDAQFYLAKMYDLGIHTKPDPKTAKTWYEKSANNGNTHAMNNLAGLLHQDWVNTQISQIYTQSTNLLKQAADQNNPVAMTNLGRRYILDNKEKEGVELLKQAGELGYAPAYYQLYDALAMGFVDSDELAAREIGQAFGYLGRAADMGYPLAIREKEDLIARSLVVSNIVMTRNQYDGGRIMVGDIANYQAAKFACLDGTEPACQTLKTISDKYRKDTPTTNPCDSKGNKDSKACKDHTARQYVKNTLNRLDGISDADDTQ